VFLPQKVADRLRKYIRVKEIDSGARIFPITYAAARLVVKKVGDMPGLNIRPHDLRRHAATYASRSGTPLEIVSFRPLSGIWEKSVMLRLCVGLIIFTDNEKMTGQRISFSLVILNNLFQYR
jgi:hypothetical protein